MRMWRCGALGVGVLALILPWSARSEAASGAVCVADYRLSFSPGVTMTPGTWTLTTNGHTGAVNCVGHVDGHLITGPGTFSQEGVGNGSCIQGGGTGTTILRIPTDGGTRTIEVAYEFSYVPGAGFKTADRLRATFQFLPTVGDCVSTPLREGHFVLEGVLS